jgi:hypothetical protein
LAETLIELQYDAGYLLGLSSFKTALTKETMGKTTWQIAALLTKTVEAFETAIHNQ